MGQPPNLSCHIFLAAVLPRPALHIVIFYFERSIGMYGYITFRYCTHWTWPVWVWHVISESLTLTRPHRQSLRACRGWGLGRPFQVRVCSYWQISTHKRLAWTWGWRVRGELFSCDLLIMMQLGWHVCTVYPRCPIRVEWVSGMHSSNDISRGETFKCYQEQLVSDISSSYLHCYARAN
jgi:hypothetical protein